MKSFVEKCKGCSFRFFAIALAVVTCGLLDVSAARAEDPVYLTAPVMPTAMLTQLTAWVAGFFVIAFAVYMIITNAGTLYWFVKMGIRRVFRFGRP